VLNRVPASRHDEIYASALYDSGQVYGDITDGIVIDESKVMIPTLTIAAGHDRATLPKGVRKVAAKYARSPVRGDFIEYPEHGHWILDEPGTEKVAADILGWLGR
jgi:alpha-beta hydrolase superfamily lysophospholipase